MIVVFKINPVMFFFPSSRPLLTLSLWNGLRKLPPISPSSRGVPGGLFMPAMLLGEFYRGKEDKRETVDQRRAAFIQLQRHLVYAAELTPFTFKSIHNTHLTLSFLFFLGFSFSFCHLFFSYYYLTLLSFPFSQPV